ncbi:MAG: Fe-S protein assembly co-chaperone HscB [Sediminibacterium sp.]|nr:Fe-S protein assembly co-chaperone HscB [uncultured Sediminibacterium sp.]
MTHFDLFELPITLKVDSSGLSKQYFALQRKYHPDRFVQASEAEQEEALQVSAQVNKAYKVLKDPDETIKYVLQLKGLLEEEEKYQLSPDFLMEVMELNEELESGITESVQNKISDLKNELYATVETIITGYQEGITSEKELLQVKAYYFKKKYLDRLLHQSR